MKILLIMESVFPYGVAWSSRARGLSKLFVSAGHSVHIISNYTFDDDYVLGSVVSFDNNISYQIISKKYNKVDRLFIGKRIKKVIIDYITNTNVDIVVTSSFPSIFKFIYTICQKKRISLYVEQCEWFDVSTFKLKKYNPYYRKYVKLMKNGYSKADGIISISSLLNNFYLAEGTRSIRIPSIMDVDNISYRLNYNNHKEINLIFVGTISGKKELLLPILNALKFVNKDCQKFVLHIFGPDLNEVMTNIDNNSKILNDLDNAVIIHGRVSQSEIENKLKESDFLIFARPNRRSSNAGFPTKFAESMAVGTPVIANLTGDLNKYLVNGTNGYVLNDLSVTSCIQVLQTILSMSHKDHINMRKCARDTAKMSFDYKNYTEELKQYFKARKVL